MNDNIVFIDVPKICPICNSETIIKKDNDSEVLICTNPYCSGKTLAKFINFVSRNCMNIEGLSEKTLELLISRGFLRTYADIFHLSEHAKEIAQLEGLGKKSVDKLLKSIEKSRNVKLENYLCAIGIPGVGMAAAKTISKVFCGDHFDFIWALTEGYDFSQLKDFGGITNRVIHQWWDNKDPLIDKLPIELNFIKEVDNTEKTLDFKFCITGSFSRSRDELKAELEKRGAQFVGSVSKNLDILFVGNKAGSKLVKAQQLGIKVMNEVELMEMLK